MREAAGGSESPGGLGDADDAVRLRMLVARMARRLERTLAGAELTPAETTVLATLARRGTTGITELAGAEGINPTMLSRVIRRLEQAGLVIREEHPADRRAAIVTLSLEGRQLHDRIRAERSDALSAQLERLSAADRARLRSALPVLERIAEQLKERRA